MKKHEPHVRRAPAARVPAALLALVCAGAPACGSSPTEDTIPVGLLLSYSGYLAANTINSERALIMAIDAGNAGGGVGGRPLRLMARDTRSDPNKVLEPAREMLAAGAPVIIGPDTLELATQLRSLLERQTMIFPSFATASIDFKPSPWFVTGAGAGRMACELVAQLRADGRQKPLVILNTRGYNSLLSWELTNRYGLPKYVLPTDQAATTLTVEPITSAAADSYVLAAFPAAGSSLIYALESLGAMDDPRRWYLSPTLHNPAFLESIPNGVLDGAHGVSPGTVAGAADFRKQFNDRWGDAPLDDAYAFYDAGAITVLALERAMIRDGALPTGTGLGADIRAVTASGGKPVQWNELRQGLELIRQGQEVAYLSLSGSNDFDAEGQSAASATKWWSITPEGFTDIANEGDCR